MSLCTPENSVIQKLSIIIIISGEVLAGTALTPPERFYSEVGSVVSRFTVCQSPGEIKRREVVLDPEESPEEIKSREVELGSESWTSFASVITQQQCYGHWPCDSAPHSS